VPHVHAFLIADVRGYSTFTREHGDELAADLSTCFAELASGAVSAAGGEVLGLRGDEIAASFASPRSAVRAAVDMQQRFAARIREVPSLPLRVGVGIDVGEAVPVDDGFRGQALNLAARLCAHAKAGDVLISEAMHHLVGRMEGITTRDVGRQRVKGFSEPVRLVKVVFPLDLPPVTAARRRRRPYAIGLLGIGLIAALATALLVRTHQPAPTAPHRLLASDIGTGIYRVNLTTGRVGLIPISRSGSAVGGLLEAFGSTWVSADDAILRLDARDRVITRVSAVTNAVGSMAAGRGRLWVMSVTPSPRSVRNLAVVVDPSNPTGNHEAPRGVPMQPLQESRQIVDNLLFGFGDLWAYPTGSQGCCPGRVFWRVDPVDGHVVSRWPDPKAAAIDSAGVWELRADSTVARISPGTNAIDPAATFPDLQGSTIAIGDGAVWVGGPPTLGIITEISPRTKTIVNRLHVDANVDGIVPTGGVLWIVDRDHFALLNVDPNTGTVVRRYPLGDIPPNSNAVVVTGDTALVAFP
jgi:class 3 adenylate cyclase